MALLLQAASAIEHEHCSSSDSFDGDDEEELLVPTFNLVSSPGRCEAPFSSASPMVPKAKLALGKVSKAIPQGRRDATLHNQVEKLRRAELAQCYDKLKRLLNIKTSNVTALRLAADHILHLVLEEKHRLKELEQLRAENKRLRGHPSAKPCCDLPDTLSMSLSSSSCEPLPITEESELESLADGSVEFQHMPCSPSPSDGNEGIDLLLLASDLLLQRPTARKI